MKNYTDKFIERVNEQIAETNCKECKEHPSDCTCFEEQPKSKNEKMLEYLTVFEKALDGYNAMFELGDEELPDFVDNMSQQLIARFKRISIYLDECSLCFSDTLEARSRIVPEEENFEDDPDRLYELQNDK